MRIERKNLHKGLRKETVEEQEKSDFYMHFHLYKMDEVLHALHTCHEHFQTISWLHQCLVISNLITMKKQDNEPKVLIIVQTILYSSRICLSFEVL
jgi:hypothetical protein